MKKKKVYSIKKATCSLSLVKKKSSLSYPIKSYRVTHLQKIIKMTTNLQQGTLLDVLKKKMRQTKEEMERYKDECEEYNRKLQLEAMRREEVRDLTTKKN